MTDGLRKRLRQVDYHGEAHVARELRLEAQRTLDKQVLLLGEIDAKVLKLLRVNVFLVGLVLTAISLAAKTDSVAVDQFLNTHLGIGILSLFLSCATAAVSYASTDVEVGVDPDDIATVLEFDLANDEFEVVAAKSYALWIDHNDSTNVLHAPWNTLTVLLTVAAIAYLALGTYAAFNDSVPLLVDAIAALVLLLLAWQTGIGEQVTRALSETSFDSLYRLRLDVAERLMREDSK